MRSSHWQGTKAVLICGSLQGRAIRNLFTSSMIARNVIGVAGSLQIFKLGVLLYHEVKALSVSCRLTCAWYQHQQRDGDKVYFLIACWFSGRPK